jgi:hypothetical protein
MPPVPQPDPIALPAPAWLLWALLMVTFLLHVIPMNLVLGGSIVAAIARMRGRRGARPHEAELARLAAKAMPVLISAAVTFGVAALLFLQVLYGRVFFPSAIVMGWWWLSVIGLLLLAYYGAYLLSYREDRLGGAGTGLAWLIAAVVGVIAVIYANNMTLMLKPAETVARYLADGRGLQLNLSDPSLLPRHLHMVLGGIALSGAAVAIAGVLRADRDAAFAAWAVKCGAFYAAGATGLNIFAGIGWLATLPGDVIFQFMTFGLWPLVILLGGILVAVCGAGALVMAAASPRPARGVWAGAALLVAGIAAMLFTRDTARTLQLAQSGFEPVSWTDAQWGPIAIFVGLFIASIVTVVWMVRLLVVGRARRAGA